MHIIKCLALLLAVIIGLLFLNAPRQEAGVIEEQASPGLTRDDLRLITPELIEERDLTVDWDLQGYIAEAMKDYKVGFAAVAVMDAYSGELLALYGKDAGGENCTLGLDTYLAASLFKVVTSVAALEYGGMSPETLFSYNGKAHTLYRDQLSTATNRWTRQISLERAFAVSNNVVFGKLAAYDLGEQPVLLSAMRLGFWTSPLKECACRPSTLFIPETTYNLAELASGFNRRTRVSPVHAGQIVSPVLTGGSMVTPRIVRSTPVERVEVFSQDTAEKLKGMMARTVRSGTVSGTFRGYARDRVLKNLVLGAKTGSINGTQPDGRRNWFVGFAEDAASGRAITVACLIIREDYYWIEADGLAKKIIRNYFAEPLTVARSQ